MTHPFDKAEFKTKRLINCLLLSHSLDSISTWPEAGASSLKHRYYNSRCSRKLFSNVSNLLRRLRSKKGALHSRILHEYLKINGCSLWFQLFPSHHLFHGKLYLLLSAFPSIFNLTLFVASVWLTLEICAMQRMGRVGFSFNLLLLNYVLSFKRVMPLSVCHLLKNKKRNVILSIFYGKTRLKVNLCQFINIISYIYTAIRDSNKRLLESIVFFLES